MTTSTARPIRTYKPRLGRVSGRHRDALDRLWPRYGAELPPRYRADLVARCGAELPTPPRRGAHPGAPDTAADAQDTATDAPGTEPGAFFGGDRAPVVLEIGSGMGEATVAMAEADPGRNYLAVEVHTPGVGNLLALVEERELGNVRVMQGDALELVALLAPASLAAVHAFFPDPWPKARHRKRRLFQPAHVALLRSRLTPGGALRCATDWAAYADDALAVLTADPELVNAHERWAPRPAERPVTKFERRGVEAGRTIRDLEFRRVAAA